ncbi:dickkopf-related protein 3 [Pelodytes ibericus]
MSGLILLILPWVLGIVAPSPARWARGTEGIGGTLNVSQQQPALTFGEEGASLNDMFKEVEELIQDSHAKLQNAVKEMVSEDGAAGRLSGPDFNDLPPNFHNQSVTNTKIGNTRIHSEQEIIKETDNKTGSTLFGERVITSLRSKESHECIVDEDCGNGNYCHFSNSQYKCLHCREEGECTRDGECCDGQLCVWGQCTKSTKGESGTICESQEDCAPSLCCSVQTSLLYPVCAPLPVKGELCHNPSSHLLNAISWDLEPEAVLDRCPCSNGLICQSQSHTFVSVCAEDEEAANPDSAEEDLPFAGSLYEDPTPELDLDPDVILEDDV